mgnify:CR=1 FL=1
MRVTIPTRNSLLNSFVQIFKALNHPIFLCSLLISDLYLEGAQVKHTSKMRTFLWSKEFVKYPFHHFFRCPQETSRIMYKEIKQM